MTATPLGLVVAAIAAWLVIGLLGLARAGDLKFVSRLLFPAGAAVGLALAIVAVLAVGAPASTAVLPLGLPDLPFHLRVDALSAFFLLLLGSAGAAISLFSAGYFRSSDGTPPGLICFQYHAFLAAMALVLVADDAYVFMVAWESMALSSFFLVTTEHRIPEIRRAGFLYLLIAHVGAIAILLCFGVLQGGTGDYTFASMRSVTLAGAWPTAAFFLALAGFGAKAGLLPLHVWLPEAHPAAPSPVSALMSGVMLKTAIYGLLRVAFDLLHVQQWWWGVFALALGLATALYGVVFAAVQSDMKRLLAYSSIENIGIIVAGIGLAILFKAYDKMLLAAITLTAVLYHSLNHAFFKSLLFLATGSVLHATKERSLGKLGGLIHRMPWVAWLALVGTLAAAGIPPLNGFVSEWLLLQAFLFTPSLPQSFVNMLVPLAAAALVLAAALAAYVMVKFFGVVFLGRPREPNLAYARDAGPWERSALVYLGAGCLLLGVLPVQVIALIDPVNALLIGGGATGRIADNWLQLAPISADRSSYAPLIVLAGIVGVVLVTMRVVHRLYHGRVRRAPPWDCGFPLQTPRMQDTAEGFGQPIRQIFEAFFEMERHLPTPFDQAPRYSVKVDDRFWRALYLPVVRSADFLARIAGLIQQGRISIYLTYSFCTLLALLFFVR
jgi:formate hydrogenlyase subunit 3/multisubunit Na+/H+ antiporter MnhD subunit